MTRQDGDSFIRDLRSQTGPVTDFVTLSLRLERKVHCTLREEPERRQSMTEDRTNAVMMREGMTAINNNRKNDDRNCRSPQEPKEP